MRDVDKLMFFFEHFDIDFFYNGRYLRAAGRIYTINEENGCIINVEDLRNKELDSTSRASTK